MMTSRTYTNSEQLWHTYSVLWRKQVLPGHKTALIVSLILNFWECRAVYKNDRFFIWIKLKFCTSNTSWLFNLQFYKNCLSNSWPWPCRRDGTETFTLVSWKSQELHLTLTLSLSFLYRLQALSMRSIHFAVTKRTWQLSDSMRSTPSLILGSLSSAASPCFTTFALCWASASVKEP